MRACCRSRQIPHTKNLNAPHAVSSSKFHMYVFVFCWFRIMIFFRIFGFFFRFFLVFVFLSLFKFVVTQKKKKKLLILTDRQYEMEMLVLKRFTCCFFFHIFYFIFLNIKRFVVFVSSLEYFLLEYVVFCSLKYSLAKKHVNKLETVNSLIYNITNTHMHY